MASAASTRDLIKECEEQLSGFKRRREPESASEPEPEPEAKRPKMKVSFAEPEIEPQPQFIAIPMVEYKKLINYQNDIRNTCIQLHKDLSFMYSINYKLSMNFKNIMTELIDMQNLINDNASDFKRIYESLGDPRILFTNK